MQPDVAFPFGDLSGIRPGLVYSGNPGESVNRVRSRTNSEGIADGKPELAREMTFHCEIHGLAGRSSERCDTQGQLQEPVVRVAQSHLGR
jgi:hypothetical protein